MRHIRDYEYWAGTELKVVICGEHPAGEYSNSEKYRQRGEKEEIIH